MRRCKGWKSWTQQAERDSVAIRRLVKLGGEKDPEVLSVDSRLLVTRFVDPDAAKRYGNMVYVRCAWSPASVVARPEKIQMKLFPLAVLFVSIGQGAIAHAFVPKASDRLACYDRAKPPIAAKPAKPKLPVSPVAASTSPPDQGQVVDMLAAENSKLDARLKTICRGCWTCLTQIASATVFLRQERGRSHISCRVRPSLVSALSGSNRILGPCHGFRRYPIAPASFGCALCFESFRNRHLMMPSRFTAFVRQFVCSSRINLRRKHSA